MFAFSFLFVIYLEFSYTAFYHTVATALEQNGGGIQVGSQQIIEHKADLPKTHFLNGIILQLWFNRFVSPSSLPPYLLVLPLFASLPISQVAKLTLFEERTKKTIQSCHPKLMVTRTYLLVFCRQSVQDHQKDLIHFHRFSKSNNLMGVGDKTK